MKRLCSLVLIVLCIIGATGCSRSAGIAPVTIVAEMGTNAAGKTLTAQMVTWDTQHGTLTLSDKPIFQRSYYNDWPAIIWSLGPPFTALQRSVDQIQDGVKQQLLMLQPAVSDIKVLAWPATLAMSVKAQKSVAWYAWDKKVFMSAPVEMIAVPHETLNGTSLTITEWNASEKTAAIPILPGLNHVSTVYGSGSLDDGFALVEASSAGSTSGALWLIRLTNGAATWLSCGDAPCGGVTSGAGPQFARIDSRLYLLGGCRTKIAMIDTAAVRPVTTYPAGVNKTFSSLVAETWKDTGSGLPFHATLGGGGTVLQLSLFNTALNAEQTYALNEDGTILGYLEQDNGELRCMNARGRRLSSLSIPDVRYFSSPSPDLFAG